MTAPAILYRRNRSIRSPSQPSRTRAYIASTPAIHARGLRRMRIACSLSFRLSMSSILSMI